MLAANQSAAASFSWTIGVMPTVSSVSPNSGPRGWDGGDDHGDELCRGSDGDVWRGGSDERGGGERDADHGDDAGGQCGGGDGDGDGQWAERKSEQRVHLRCSADGEQRIAEQRVNDRRDSGDDHGDELCCGSDGDVRRGGSDERGGGERDADHGDDAGR